MGKLLSYESIARLFDFIFKDALESERQRADAREMWLCVLEVTGWTEEEWETALEERLDHKVIGGEF